MTPLKNILVVRTDRIGDVVLTLPIASIIKKHFPDSRVTFFLSEYTKPLAENNPFIDDVITPITSNGKIDIISNVKQIKNKFDCVITAFPTYKIALILFLSGIKTRVGSGYRWYSFLFNRKVFDHRKTAEHHELEYNVRLLQQIGVNEDINPSSIEFGLRASQKSEQTVNAKLRGLGINANDKFIIIHPGSGGSALDLPIDSLKKIVQQLSITNKIKILLTGSEKEKTLCQLFALNNNTLNVASLFSLSEMIALIDRSILLISNSTGPIHIAAALGKQVIGFYPKVRTCSEERWGPYTNKKVIFKPDNSCSGHTIEQCREQNCMASIKVEEVLNTINSKI
ncbi:MAG: glycosyltransferase family 9 protein [Bacteroidota bacterium]